ncbi:MAG: S41 family peptidase [Thermoplasmata archaeon]
MARQLSPAERAYIASSIRGAIDLVFAHGDGIPKIDLDAAYRRLLDTLLTRGDRRRFSLEMAAFAATLNNGHTSYRDPVGWARFMGSIGFDATPLDSEWVVTRAWRPGVRVGQLLERVDGKSPEELFRGLRRYISASSERGRRSRMFSQEHLFPRRLAVQVDGRIVVCHRGPGRWEPPPPRTSGRWLRRGSVAYLRIPSFGDPAHEARALQLLRRYRRAEAIVIDVRGNTGGSTPSGLIGALMDRSWQGWTISTPLRIGLARANTQLLELLDHRRGEGLRLSREQLAPLEVFRDLDRARLLIPSSVNPERPNAYHGRVILLVDERCRSACEDFLLPFKTTGRGTLVGTTTDGSTGQPYVLEFPDGIRALIGALRAYLPDGRPFEGVGLAPDREVRPTREDLVNGRDPVLEAATDFAGPR